MPGLPLQPDCSLVSVVIPAYNQAGYVRTSVGSVLAQTYPHFELVVVDDGSTDETPQVLAGIQDPRLRVVRQTNGGLSAARNTGLRETSAPLVTFLDADDYFTLDKLEILVDYLETHPKVGLVAGRTRFVDSSGNTIREQTSNLPPLELPYLLTENPICVSGVLLRREWLACVGVFDASFRACEDWDLWLRLLAAGCQMAWVEQVTINYRTHPGQMTRESARMRRAMLAMLDKFFSQPGLPPALQAHRDQAYAAAMLKAAAYAYHGQEIEAGQRDLAEALRLDPGLAKAGYAPLVKQLAGWSQDPRSTDQAEFLQRIIAYPPPGHAGLQRPLRRAMADVLLAPLFAGSPEVLRARKGDLLKAIVNKPEWLLNRGVLRMLADAWLHL